MTRQPLKHNDGFSLFELVIVLLLLALLAATAAPRFRSGDSTLDFQTDQFARELRHAQALAMNWGIALDFQVNTVAGIYQVVCAQVAGPCAAIGNLITDPATGQVFQSTLNNGVSFSAATGSVIFDYEGTASVAGNYNFSSDTKTRTVTLLPLTGLVSVTSP